MPTERVLDIGSVEAKDGSLDNVLLDAFVDARVFDVPSAPTSPG